MRMHVMIRTWMRLISNLERCKTRLSPSWANASWASFGMFVPFLISALGDATAQEQAHKPFTFTIWMVAAIASLVALLASVLAYLTAARVEDHSIDTVLAEMREHLDSWTE